MSKSEIVSIIVPVYKVEKYLDQCVSSIVNQTYKNLEIILVDDGSPDRSGSICDEWAAKDSRIRVIHQTNAGGGAARNAALDVARGELIAFVDSDDYIASDMFEHLYGLLEQGADIAECSYIDVFDDLAVFSCTDTAVRTYTAQEAIAEHINDRIFRQLIWNKLYRRKMIGNIRFPVDRKIDDEFFTYQVLGNAKTLIRSEKICYAYRQQESSVMHSMSTQKRLQAVEAKVQRHRYIEKYYPDLTSISVKNLWFTCIFQGQLSLLTAEPDESKQTLAYLETVLGSFPCEIHNCTIKEKLWLLMARVSLPRLCRLRNALKIGL